MCLECIQNGILVSGVGHGSSKQMAPVIYCSLREREGALKAKHKQRGSHLNTQKRREDSPISSFLSAQCLRPNTASSLFYSSPYLEFIST